MNPTNPDGRDWLSRTAESPEADRDRHLFDDFRAWLAVRRDVGATLRRLTEEQG